MIRRGHRGRPPGSWRRAHQIPRPINQPPKDERLQPGGIQPYQTTPRSTRTFISSLQPTSTKNMETDSFQNGGTRILESPNHNLESVQNKPGSIDSTCFNQVGVNMDLNIPPDPATLVRLSLWMRMFGGQLTSEKLIEMRSQFLKTLQPNNERLIASNTHPLCCSKRLPGTTTSSKPNFSGFGTKPHLLESEDHDGLDQPNRQVFNLHNLPPQNALVTFPSFQPRSTISLMKPTIQSCQTHAQITTNKLFSYGLENLKLIRPELLRSHQNRYEVDAKSLTDPLNIPSTPWFAPMNWQTLSCPNTTGFGQGNSNPKGNEHIVSPVVPVTIKSRLSAEESDSNHWTLSNGTIQPLDLSFKASGENDDVQSMKELRSTIVGHQNDSTENNLNPVILHPFCENLPVHVHSKQFHKKSSCSTSLAHSAEHMSSEMYRRKSESIDSAGGITTSCCTTDSFSRRKRSRPSQLSLSTCLASFPNKAI
ncbi:hypothetical protein EG68_05508 [Paragonimus skrjabini miyazakii]|uniref:Uncharacterized protein n=1 Tax=Paragonimus skrjabini miyazakii TaxID=59628 RepID=A0A8S9YXB9_9TREM|nr:hypothetical protein EG68_05508 [Paragonimus skrjabini miyazakii]